MIDLPKLTIDQIFERSQQDPNSGCWLWMGMVCRSGYGMLSYRGKNVRAHRVALAAKIGAIPDGYFACHKCDTPTCVNPDHLYAGSARQNMRDAIARGRAFRQGVKADRATYALTDDDVTAIFLNGDKHDVIAERFGVHKTLVNQIKRGVVFPHITARLIQEHGRKAVVKGSPEWCEMRRQIAAEMHAKRKLAGKPHPNSKAAKENKAPLDHLVCGTTVVHPAAKTAL